MQDGYQPSVESSGQIVLSPHGGVERPDASAHRVNELEGRVNSFENMLHEFGAMLAQMREQMQEINKNYQEILDKHDQLVVYIQSSTQYCENKESIDALFDYSEENSRAAVQLNEKLESLEGRLIQAENEAKGKMPLAQGEQLLKVLKFHHSQITELIEKLNEE